MNLSLWQISSMSITQFEKKIPHYRNRSWKKNLEFVSGKSFVKNSNLKSRVLQGYFWLKFSNYFLKYPITHLESESSDSFCDLTLSVAPISSGDTDSCCNNFCKAICSFSFSKTKLAFCISIITTEQITSYTVTKIYWVLPKSIYKLTGDKIKSEWCVICSEINQ